MHFFIDKKVFLISFVFYDNASYEMKLKKVPIYKTDILSIFIFDFLNFKFYNFIFYIEKTDDKAMVVMAVNRYCINCMESGEFLSLKLVMMNLNSGVWMCPKEEVYTSYL